jgi:hypothetical protein
MPRTADDELGVGNETPRYGRETVETILTDTDKREPAVIGCVHLRALGPSACAS